MPATNTVRSLGSSCEGMIIGLVAEFYFSDVDDEVARCVWAAIGVLRAYGAQVKKISLAGLKDCEYALTIIDTCETSTVHRANLRDRPQNYGDDVRLLLECGELPSAVDYLEAQQIRRHLRAEVQAAFSQVDVVAGPTLPIRRRTIGKETAKINGRDVDALENLIRLVGPASLLGLSVYAYSLAMMSHRAHSRFEKAGNYAYALAVLVLPIFAGLYLSAKLADRVAVSHVAWAAPAVAVSLGVGWLALSQLLAWHIRGRLGEGDRAAKLAQLARQERESLGRARDLFRDEHFDLCVVEAWRALESRLRQILLARRVGSTLDSTEAVLHVATRRGVLVEPVLGLVDEMRRHWTIAVSTEPLEREAAASSLSAAKHILAVLPAEAAHRAATK